MNVEREAAQAAAAFRAEHGLGAHPLGDLVALIEQTTGYDVAIVDAADDEHGLTIRDPDNSAVFIAAARTRNPMRQRSSLAHELAHVLFNDWAHETGDSLGVRSPQEKRADAFARHLLIPRTAIRGFLGTRDDVVEADLSAVVQRFLVSPAIAAIALHQCGYIGPAIKQAWMEKGTPQLAAQFGWTDQYAMLQTDSYTARSPQRLVARAIAGYREGVISVQTIATLRGVTLEQAEAELAQAGVEPRQAVAEDLAAVDLPDVTVDLSDLEDDAE